jgi:sugar lactone lactonase YvrE
MSPSRSVSLVAKGFSFLEAPRWHNNKLYVSDFYNHRVCAIDEAGTVTTVCSVPEQPSGLGFTPNDKLLIVSMRDRRVVRLEKGKLIQVADLSAMAPYHCNDMLVDTQGRAYVGNFGWNTDKGEEVRPTVLILLHPNGKLSIAADDLVFPNGSVLTPDGKTMIVAETFAMRLTAFDVAADGSLHNRRIWASFSQRRHKTIADAIAARELLPDGLNLDAEGAIWVTDAAGHGISRMAEGGKVLEFIDTGDMAVYAATLGGRDSRSLYLCASPPLPHNPVTDPRACLLACRVDVPGAGLP